MSQAFEIDPHTKAMQARASEPTHSAWVSANAGSGKTFVLSRRVVRLLLAGVEPSRILCLTYTKAAAGEMSNRVFEILGKWAVMTDAQLREELLSVEGKTTHCHPDEPGPHPVCESAGNARRSEDPDHPCLLRSAVAPVST